MNLYLDTSALVKLYVVEEHTPVVERANVRAEHRWISLVGYTEVCSALARRLRERKLTVDGHNALIRMFNQDWWHLDQVIVDPELAFHAGSLARKHALRALDAIHLASAVRVMSITGNVTFLSFDAALSRAATAEGLGQV